MKQSKITIALEDGSFVIVQAEKTGYAMAPQGMEDCLRVWANTEAEKKTVIVPIANIKTITVIESVE